MTQRNDDTIDGYDVRPKRDHYVLADEIHEIRTEMNVFAGTLAAFKIDTPQTVSIEVSLEFNPGKFIKCGTARVLAKGESITTAHVELYRQCLNSISEITS